MTRARVFLICFLAALLEGGDSQIMALAVPQLATAWGHPAPDFALVFSFTSLGTALGAAIGGRLSDSIGRKWALVLATAGLGLLTLAIVLSSTIPVLIILRFLGGLCLGGTLVSVVAIASDNSGPAQRLRNTMMVYTAVPLGAMLGALLGGHLFKFGDWRLIFYVGGLSALVLVPAIMALLPESKAFLEARKAIPAEPAVQNAASQGLLSKDYRARTLALWLTSFVALTAIFCLNAWLPTVLTRATGSAATASLLTSLVYLGSVIGVFLMATVVNRVGAERLLIIVFLISAATCVAIQLAIHDPGVAVISGLIVLGAGLLGGNITLTTLGATVYPTEMRGRGVGVSMGIGRAGAFLGPAIGGAVLASPVYKDQLFLVIAALIVLAAGAISLLAHVRRTAAARVA